MHRILKISPVADQQKPAYPTLQWTLLYKCYLMQNPTSNGYLDKLWWSNSDHQSIIMMLVSVWQYSLGQQNTPLTLSSFLFLSFSHSLSLSFAQAHIHTFTFIISNLNNQDLLSSTNNKVMALPSSKVGLKMPFPLLQHILNIGYNIAATCWLRSSNVSLSYAGHWVNCVKTIFTDRDIDTV